MTHRLKSKKILIPDVPPSTVDISNQGLVVASIGTLCAAVAAVAALLLYFGA
jgi:hypothetical protein